MYQLKCQKSQPTVKLKVPGETQKVGWKVTFQALSIKETFSLCCPNNGKNSERVWGQKEASKRLCVRLNHWRSSWGGLVRRLEGKRGLCATSGSPTLATSGGQLYQVHQAMSCCCQFVTSIATINSVYIFLLHLIPQGEIFDPDDYHNQFSSRII